MPSVLADYIHGRIDEHHVSAHHSHQHSDTTTSSSGRQGKPSSAAVSMTSSSSSGGPVCGGADEPFVAMPTAPGSAAKATPKRRAVFVLFEGTGNDFQRDSYTNVVRMLRLLRKDQEESQIVYYGEGLGRHNWSTGGELSNGTSLTKLGSLLSMGLGVSFPEHVLDAYRWLMNVYHHGDEIYVLGFSRGAYAAGCFCGLIEKVGLLPRDNDQLISTAWSIYAANDEEKAESFRTSFTKFVRIHFLGLWDTVASLGRNNSAPYPFAQHHGSVTHVRHAMALDEVRNRFVVHRYPQDLKAPLYRPTTNMSKSAAKEQLATASALRTSVEEVWFPGNHTDVGGGGHNDKPLPEARVALPRFLNDSDKLTVDVETRIPHPALGFLSLRWMLKSLLELKSNDVDILLDPFTAARYDLELSYSQHRDVSRHEWPDRHLAHLLKTTSKEDRLDANRASISLEGCPIIPLPELELATLRSYTAFEAEPESTGFKDRYIMPRWWIWREVMDGTLGEVREVRPDDKLHTSVRTRWIASRFNEEQYATLFDLPFFRKELQSPEGIAGRFPARSLYARNVIRRNETVLNQKLAVVLANAAKETQSAQQAAEMAGKTSGEDSAAKVARKERVVQEAEALVAEQRKEAVENEAKTWADFTTGHLVSTDAKDAVRAWHPLAELTGPAGVAVVHGLDLSWCGLGKGWFGWISRLS